MRWFVFFLVMATLGAAVAVRHGFIPALWPFPGWATSLVGGAVFGSAVAALARVLWRRFGKGFEKEGVEVCLANGLLLAFAGAGAGAVLAVAVRLLFAAGAGARVAQGVLLAGGLCVGLCVGFSLKGSLFSSSWAGRPAARGAARSAGTAGAKVLDTSVIIDGRIGDLLRTGFLEGEVVVPEFILGELQNVADSPNSLRRRKGRRGLEILHELMQDERVDLRVSSLDYPSIKEVDRKLIRMVKEGGGTLVTTDYNLNRVAQVEGVRILNVNELANAVKPRFIPGEELTVEVIDRGEEIGQGVGYLDDGTMVVVENGRRHIGRTIKATVKSTLQTEAGRMLFVEPCGETPTRWENK
jgi:predicted nucleic acid-binding protein